MLSSAEGVCAVLQPLFDIGDVRELNGPTGYRLAELIYPRNAADLTVRQVLALLGQIDAEQDGARLSDAPYDGVDHINIERIRQKTVEGRDAEHDRQYVAGELARAAACYALPMSDPRRTDATIFGGAPDGWPWDRKRWKPAHVYDDGRGNPVVEPEARIRELEKAGALIAAEIDRIKLASANQTQAGAV